jgi:hypothetical protein
VRCARIHQGGAIFGRALVRSTIQSTPLCSGFPSALLALCSTCLSVCLSAFALAFPALVFVLNPLLL